MSTTSLVNSNGHQFHALLMQECKRGHRLCTSASAKLIVISFHETVLYWRGILLFTAPWEGTPVNNTLQLTNNDVIKLCKINSCRISHSD